MTDPERAKMRERTQEEWSAAIVDAVRIGYPDDISVVIGATGHVVKEILAAIDQARREGREEAGRLTIDAAAEEMRKLAAKIVRGYWDGSIRDRWAVQADFEQIATIIESFPFSPPAQELR